VHLIGTGDGEAEIGAGEAAGQFLSRLTGEANPAALAGIRTWLWPPTAAGLLGARAESAAGAAALCVKVAAAWQPGRADGEADR
jgi:mevalonate pyrophosphate decarboxylase